LRSLDSHREYIFYFESLPKIIKGKKLIGLIAQYNINHHIYSMTVFSKLRPCLDSLPKVPHPVVISEQISEQGARRFQSFDSVSDMAKYIILMGDPNKHAYELLPENIPRYLYLDVEYLHAEYQHGVDVIELIINFMGGVISKLLGIDLPLEVDVKIGTASDATKCSYHFKFDDVIFEDCQHLKDFIKVLKEEVKTEPRLHDINGKCIIDFHPYGRNQNFRMLGQSKFGSNRILRSTAPSESFESHLVGYYDQPTTFAHLNDAYIPSCPITRHISEGREGMTELESGEHEIVEIDDANDPIQLLDCIPNINQSYETWIEVGMCLHKLGDMYLQAWIDWSNLSTKGNRQHCIDQWKTFNRDKPNAIGLPRLRKLAMHYQPQIRKLLNQEQATLSDLVDLKPLGYQQETYNHTYVKPYPLDKYDTVFEQSQMGTGKTYQIKEAIMNLLKLKPSARIIWPTARKTFASNMMMEVNRETGAGFRLYSSIRHDINTTQCLMIQMESLHKLNGLIPYDLMILDESESCLKQFASETTMKIHLYEVVAAFEKIVKECTKMIICDAFMTMRSVALLSLRSIDSTIIRTNLHIARERRATKLDSKSHFVNHLVGCLRSGAKCYAVVASKQMIKDFEDKYGNEFKILSYHGDKDDKHIRTLDNVNQKWTKEGFQLVITTATITVGINCNAKYFDYIYLYGSTYGATPRDLLQSHMRVRHISTDTIYYYLYTTGNSFRRNETTLEAISKRSDEILKLNVPYMEAIGISPTWFKNVMFHCQLEENLTGHHVEDLYNYYFHVLGYTLSKLTTDEEFEATKTNDFLIPYDQIADINDTEADAITESIKFGESTFKDRNMLLKHYFHKAINGREYTHLGLSMIYNRYYASPQDRIKFFKIRSEVNSEEGYSPAFPDLQIATGLEGDLIHAVTTTLGLRHSQDMETDIPRHKMDSLRKLSWLPNVVNTTIPATHPVSDDPVTVVNRVLHHQGHTHCKTRRHRVRVDGKETDLPPSYQLSAQHNDDWSPQVLASMLKEDKLVDGKCLC